MSINVLVTGVGGGVGQGIMKALKMSQLDCRIIAADAHPLAAGLYRGNVGYVVPTASSLNYVRSIIKICREQNVDAILIGSDPELPVLAQNKKVIEEVTGAKIIVSSPEVIKIGYDKWETYRFLKKNKLEAPHTFLPHQVDEIKDLVKNNGFPLVVKPRWGSASKGVYIASNVEELNVYMNKTTDPIIQEYVGQEDEEYTSGLFVSKDQQIVGVITIKRELYNGTTYRAIVDYYDNIEHEVRKIGNLLQPTGPCNIQMRKSEKGAVTIEINPRFSGTTVIRANLGFNGPEAALRHFVLGENLGTVSYNCAIALRYWNEIYFPFDDYEKVKKNGKVEHSESETASYL